MDERWVLGTLANCSVTWGKGGLEGFVDKMLTVVLFFLHCTWTWIQSLLFKNREVYQIQEQGFCLMEYMQVAAGGTHSVVLTEEGHVWTWGQPWPPGDM